MLLKYSYVHAIVFSSPQFLYLPFFTLTAITYRITLVTILMRRIWCRFLCLMP